MSLSALSFFTGLLILSQRYDFVCYGMVGLGVVGIPTTIYWYRIRKHKRNDSSPSSYDDGDGKPDSTPDQQNQGDCIVDTNGFNHRGGTVNHTEESQHHTDGEKGNEYFHGTPPRGEL